MSVKINIATPIAEHGGVIYQSIGFFLFMNNVTFISTMHVELGRCNSEELFYILKKLEPDVVFLEAVDETYSDYEEYLFTNYGVCHRKLELSAIQKYCLERSLQYVPVCENYLSEDFHKKNQIVCKNKEMQQLIDNFNYLAAEQGFAFLNSLECIGRQEEMRALETRILNDSELERLVKENIDEYEKPMIRNIYSYCSENFFEKAVFMCGSAHRKSIIEMIEKAKREEPLRVTWDIYGS